MLTWARSSSNTCFEFGRLVERFTIFLHLLFITDFFLLPNFLGSVVSHGKQASGKKESFLPVFLHDLDTV
jgi:hypothetical protein